jgi:hypothetical protein
VQTKLEEQKHDEATQDATDKYIADHRIGELNIGNKDEICCCGENCKKYVLKHGYSVILMRMKIEV